MNSPLTSVTHLPDHKIPRGGAETAPPERACRSVGGLGFGVVGLALPQFFPAEQLERLNMLFTLMGYPTSS